MIVTGERRFLALKKLSFDMIPCKVIEIKDEDRITRQLVENIQRNSLMPFETAEAVYKLWKSYYGRAEVEKNSNSDKGFSELARKLGKKIDWIREQIDITEAPKKMQEAMKKGEVTTTMVRALNRTPDEHKEKMEEKILKGEFESRDNAIQVARRLKERPDKAKEILKQDYSKIPNYCVGQKLAEIAPLDEDYYNASENYFANVQKAATTLYKLIEMNPLGTQKSRHILQMRKAKMINELQLLPRMIEIFVKGASDIPVIETEILDQ